MEAQNQNKRLRKISYVSSSTGKNQNQNLNLNPSPISVPNVPGYNQDHVDKIVSSFLSLHDLTSPLSIESSIDRVLEKTFEFAGDISVQDCIAVRTLELASILQESTKKYIRKYATLFNPKSWPFPDELTVKMFSMLDTKSLMQASACCTMFNKLAMEPLCYPHIELTAPDVHDSVVSRKIFLAGKELRSLKVGHNVDPQEPRASVLTGLCFAPLYEIQGFKRDLLRRIHIYDFRWLGEKQIRGVLSACPNLTDLKITRLSGCALNKLVDYIPRGCQHLFIEKKEYGYGDPRFSYVPSFEMKWPNITSLSLIGFVINDRDVYRLVKAHPKLKYMDLSRTYEMTGSFLRYYSQDTLLKTLILRDCSSLLKGHVDMLLDSLMGGNSKFIRHIDVSSNRGRVYYGRINKPFRSPLEELQEKRPGLTLVTDLISPSSSSESSSSSSSSYYSSSSSSSEHPSSSGNNSPGSESEDNGDF